MVPLGVAIQVLHGLVVEIDLLDVVSDRNRCSVPSRSSAFPQLRFDEGAEVSGVLWVRLEHLVHQPLESVTYPYASRCLS